MNTKVLHFSTNTKLILLEHFMLYTCTYVVMALHFIIVYITLKNSKINCDKINVLI